MLTSQPLAATASQFAKPAAHVSVHAPAVHAAAAFAPPGHTAHVGPHAAGVLTSAFATHRSPHFVNPALQVNPHAFDAQVARPFAGTGHAMQSGPHAVGSVFVLQAPAHAWKFGLHVNVQTPAAQPVVALATSGHLMLQPPQWFVLESGSTQSAPQARGAAGVQPFVHWKPAPAGAHSGAAAPQTALHAPQLVAFDRSVSQPSPPLPLQSA